jgi:hypothetical protein
MTIKWIKLAALGLLALASVADALTIEIDYRYDVNNFFDTPEKRAAMQQVADRWSAIITQELGRVTLSDNSQDVRIGFTHPGTGEFYAVGLGISGYLPTTEKIVGLAAISQRLPFPSPESLVITDNKVIVTFHRPLREEETVLPDSEVLRLSMVSPSARRNPSSANPFSIPPPKSRKATKPPCPPSKGSFRSRNWRICWRIWKRFEKRNTRSDLVRRRLILCPWLRALPRSPSLRLQGRK